MSEFLLSYEGFALVIHISSQQTLLFIERRIVAIETYLLVEKQSARIPHGKRSCSP